MTIPLPTRTRILVLDDVKDWQTTLCGVLEDEGFDACGVSTVEEALNLVQASDFDIALLDIRLDETDEDNKQGIELARKFQSLKPDLKIVMITGYGRVQLVNETMQRDWDLQSLAKNFLEKKDTGDLIKLIKQLI